ncbi:JAB domain-containing protein [Pseudomonas aeruginosa]|uniref:JAB domain-containing protein n=1 Tax=Pseudomonas aeruginosa TaxID=287 RepID=UPI0031BAB9A0
MSLVANDSRVEPRFAPASQSDDWIIRQAIALLEQRLFKKGPSLERPAAVKDYLRLKLAAEPNEIFAIVFLNSMHEVLAYEPMFRGTIHSTSVHARPIVQRALELNAAAVIFSHYVPRHIMHLMCPVFLCGPASETWRTAMVSRHRMGT